jgi:hypothetical protein
MGRTKDYIISMMDRGIDVLHPNYVSDEEYYEKYEEQFYKETKKKDKKMVLQKDVHSDLETEPKK